ncbi:MAG: ankyrin repeat domain-containing protein [Bryobacteraceae bacterium]|nr:ankyrin repeat domain-containing protein [Bryobacteraceae bacterium]
MTEFDETQEQEFTQPPEIIAAAYGGDPDWARAILEQDPSQTETRDDFLGTTPLIIACHRWATQRGFRELVEVLLEAGADVNGRELASGTTPLHWAAEAGNPDLIELLAEKGADLDALDDWYRLGPLGWATLVDWAPDFRNDRQGAAEKLLALDARLDPFSAVLLNESARLRGLLEQDPAAASQRLGFLGQGQQPLHLAVVRGNREMAGVLIDGGADVNALTGWGLSALALAYEAKDSAMVDQLGWAGAKADLSAALYSGDFAAARSLPLLEDHRFLIHACVKAGRAKAVEVLLELGADPNLRVPYVVDDQPGDLSAVEMAIHGEKGEILRLFQAKGLLTEGDPAES